MIIPMLCVTIFVILVVWFLLPRVARLMIHTPTAISIFFQAKDGIRVVAVTGVQTCALPIFARLFPTMAFARRASFGIECSAATPKAACVAGMCVTVAIVAVLAPSMISFGPSTQPMRCMRSEARRVGTEGWSAWSAEQ